MLGVCTTSVWEFIRQYLIVYTAVSGSVYGQCLVGYTGSFGKSIRAVSDNLHGQF